MTPSPPPPRPRPHPPASTRTTTSIAKAEAEAKATGRITTLSNHLLPSSSPPPAIPMSMPTPAATAPAPEKPPITCHVLDTTIGRPAAGIPVSLRLENPASSFGSTSSSLSAAVAAAEEEGGREDKQARRREEEGKGKRVLEFKGVTNSDGRVVSWRPSPSPSPSSAPTSSLVELNDVFRNDAETERQRWRLCFDVRSYLLGKMGTTTTTGGGGSAEEAHDDDDDNNEGKDLFFEDVEVKFVVSRAQRQRGEHFHVPLLLGGFGYTVYRGS